MTGLLEYITQGPRIFLSSLKTKISPKKYSGTSSEICQQIVKECWNGRYFQTSTQNFPHFWTRDFGWCTSSLLKLGYQKEVQHTLRFALNTFSQHGTITTTITPKGKPFDFPTMAVDSLPWLIHSIKLAKVPYLAYHDFLNKEIVRFHKEVINPITGLVRPDRHFSSMKDLSKRKSSCYDNCMVAMLASDLKTMKLDNPFEKCDYPALIKKHFWNGTFFFDDLSQQDYIAADANLFPIALGIITDKDIITCALAAIRAQKLDEPLPLRYTESKQGIQFVWQEKIALPNYEGDTCWSHMGLLYIKFIHIIDPELAAAYKKKYADAIEKYKGFVEVYTSSGKPYSSWYYTADRSMLWAANYLTL